MLANIKPIYFIGLGLLVLSLIIFIIYYFKSNANAIKAMRGRLNYARPYSVKIDIGKNTISTYTHEGNAVGKDYNLKDFIKQLDNAEYDKWETWRKEIEESGVEELENKSLIIGVHYLISTRKVPVLSKDNKWYKLTFVAKNKSSYFFTAVELSARAVKKLKNPASLIDKDEFINKLDSFGVTAHGALVLVKFNLYSMIKKRYGDEIALRYVKEIWEEIDSYNSPFCYAAHYEEDNFVLYYPNYVDKHALDRYVKSLYDNFVRNIVFENHRFDIVPNIGVAFMGYYTRDIDGVISEAYEAAVESEKHEVHLYYYSDELERRYQKKHQSERQLDNIIEKMNIDTEYYPILSLHSGSAVGYFSSIDFTKYESVNGLNEVFEYAKETDKEDILIKTFNQKLLSSFVKYEDRKSNKLFVFCDLKYLEDLIHIASSPNYSDIKIVSILTHYSDLVDAGEQGLDILVKARQAKIELGVVANEDMQTSIVRSLRAIDWLLIPVHMATTINEDQKVRITINNIVDSMARFNLKIIAWNVDSYAKAETLKSIGVGYMHGPILDSRQDYENNSVRKIAKLLDERE